MSLPPHSQQPPITQDQQIPSPQVQQQTAPNYGQTTYLQNQYGMPAYQQMAVKNRNRQLFLVPNLLMLGSALCFTVHVLSYPIIWEIDPHFLRVTISYIVVNLIVGWGLYTLVFVLLWRGKRSGRVTGTVFAGLSVFVGTTVGFYGMIVHLLLGVSSLLWALFGIAWIIFVYTQKIDDALGKKKDK